MSQHANLRVDHVSLHAHAMPLLAAPGVFARSPDVGSTIDKLVNSSLPVVAEREAVCTGRVRAMLAMLAILPQTVGSRVHFVECPSTAQIGTRVVVPEPAGSWSLSAAACGSDSPSRVLKIRNPGEVLGSGSENPSFCAPR